MRGGDVARQKERERQAPVPALLARKALEMVDVGLGSHHHLEGWNNLNSDMEVNNKI